MYYEDFHDAGKGNEHFLDRYRIDASDNPLQSLMNARFHHAVIRAIEALPDREKILMALYYEQEMTLKEIGAVMGIAESRISQLQSQAIARMRAYLRRKKKPIHWRSRECHAAAVAPIAASLIGKLIKAAASASTISAYHIQL